MDARSQRERLSLFVIRLAIIIAILAFSFYIVPLVPPTFAVLCIVAIIAVLGSRWLIRKPLIGVIAFVPISLIIPFEVNTGTGSNLSIAVLFVTLLIGLLLLEMVVANSRMQPVNSRTVRPLLLFALVCVLSLIVGQLPWFPIERAPISAQIGGLAVFLLSAGLFLLVPYRVHELRWLEKITWLFLSIAALIIGTLAFPRIFWPIRGLIIADSLGSMFWVWFLTLALGQALLNEKLRLGWRLLLLALVLGSFLLAFIVNGDWKSGWVPVLFGMATLVVARWPRLALVAVALGIVVAPGIVAGIIASDEYSYATRLEAWQLLAEMLKVNPFLGLGPANYYWYTPLFPIRGYDVNFNSHNQYIDLVAQSGVLGLFFFLWFAWEMIRLGWRLRTQVPTGFARAYVYGMIGGLGGTLAAGVLGDWILPFVYNVGLRGLRISLIGWLFMGGLVALEQIVMRTQNASAGHRQV